MSRVIASFESGRHTATVHARNHDGEYKVRFFTDGTHAEESDYFTDDKDDALATARHQCERSAVTDFAFKAA